MMTVVPSAKDRGAVRVQETAKMPEPSVATSVGVKAETKKVPVELSEGLPTIELGQVTTGGVVSMLVTINVHVFVFPAVSRAVQVTVV